MVTQPQIDRILQDVDASTGFDELERVTVALRDYFRISHVAYQRISSLGEQDGCGTYSRAWRNRYLRQKYQRIDPAILSCSKNPHPVDWKRLNWSSNAAKAFFKDAVDHGVGNQGYTIPIRGNNGMLALFTFTDSCSDSEWADFLASHRRDLLLIGHYVHHKALAFDVGHPVDVTRPLSPREIDAMTLIALGYNRAQVARSLSISEHTLRAYIESARFKLGASNTTHAVARAVSLGLIAV